MKENFKYAMIPLATLILIVGWKWDPNRSATPDAAVATDAALVEMGQRYRTAFDAAGQAALDAAAHSTATTGQGITQGQQDALRAALTSAATPIADELTRRFGAMGTRIGGGGTLGDGTTTVIAAEPADRIRAFWRDVAAGYRKGAK